MDEESENNAKELNTSNLEKKGIIDAAEWEALTRHELGVNATGCNSQDKERNTGNRKRITVEQQVLTDSILEVERQSEIEAYLTLGYVKQLRVLADNLEAVLNAEQSDHAKNLLYRHFLSNEEQSQLFTNERIQDWQDEAAAFMQDS